MVIRVVSTWQTMMITSPKVSNKATTMINLTTLLLALSSILPMPQAKGLNGGCQAKAKAPMRMLLLPDGSEIPFHILNFVPSVYEPLPLPIVNPSISKPLIGNSLYRDVGSNPYSNPYTNPQGIMSKSKAHNGSGTIHSPSIYHPRIVQPHTNGRTR